MSGSLGTFQTQVGGLPAPGVEGDFADFNPGFTVLGGPGGIVAGPAGVLVGRFVWLSTQGMDPDNAPQIANNFGYGVLPDGIVPRPGQQAIITPYLDGASMQIPPGLPVWILAGGRGLWVKNNGPTACYRGMKAYANFTNGNVSFAPTGNPTTASLTNCTIAPATTVSFTGSITGNVLTVTQVSAGTLVPGTVISGTGVVVGSQIVAQLSGTTGGVGTYALNYGEQSTASETMTGTYGVLTVGGGSAISGGVLSGSGVTSGTVVWGQLTNTTWVVSPSQTVSTATNMTETMNIETKFYALTGGAVGEIVKISDVVQ